MSLKQIDPKAFMNLIAFAVAVGVIFAVVGWAYIGLQQAQTFHDPVQQEIQKDNLL